jgi:hypothetical protein
MSIRAGLGKVKNSNPERFIFASADDGIMKKVEYFSETELRAWLEDNILDKTKIDSVIEEARRKEVL